MNKGQTVKGGLDVNIPNALSILRILLTPLFAATGLSFAYYSIKKQE